MAKPTLNFDKPLPARTRRRTGSKYAPLVEEFLKANAPSAAVEATGKAKPTAVAAGLKNAINQLAVGDQVHVSTRGGEGVWLVRMDMDVENRSVQRR